MINLFQPNIDINDAVMRYRRILESGWLGRGAVTAEFEAVIADFIGVEHGRVHCVASCTSAIFEICSALALGPSDTVIVPTNSFPSVPAAVVATGAELCVVDIDIQSGNISLNELKCACKNSPPKAVFVTDYGGIPVSVAAIREIVGDECAVLVDAAASFGTRYKHRKDFIHEDADFVCYSFDAMKLVTCGEGGAAVIKNPELMLKFKEFSYLGLPARQKSGLDVAKNNPQMGWWEYDLNCSGRRSIMSDINAGLGLSQMLVIEDKLTVRDKLRREYESNLKDISSTILMGVEDSDFDFSNYFCTLLTPRRDELARHLLANDVYTSFRYWPIHKMKFFKDACCDRKYPAGDYLATCALNLPIHDSLTVKDIRRVSDLIIDFFRVAEVGV